ncbi:2716_t:CDS:2, partial [Acaulospora colombiana]
MEDKHELHPLLSLLSASFWVICETLAHLFGCEADPTGSLAIDLGQGIDRISSLNFYTLAFMFCVAVVSLSFLIRSRYLSTYKELRELPLGKP